MPLDTQGASTASPAKEVTDTAAATVKTTTTQTTQAPKDTTVLGRIFATPGVATLFKLGIAVLAAFIFGAVAQRTYLGAFGFKLGPIELSELPPVTKAETLKAVERIKTSPMVEPLLTPGPRGPQPIPQVIFLEEEGRVPIISIRLQLEEALRKLGGAQNIDADVPLRRVIPRLVATAVIDEAAAKGLLEMLDLGDRVIAGADIESDVVSTYVDEGLHVIYGVEELTRLSEEAAAAARPP